MSTFPTENEINRRCVQAAATPIAADATLSGGIRTYTITNSPVLTLPTKPDYTTEITLHNIGTGTATIDPGSQTINGSTADITLGPNRSYILKYNPTNTIWYIPNFVQP